MWIQKSERESERETERGGGGGGYSLPARSSVATSLLSAPQEATGSCLSPLCFADCRYLLKCLNVFPRCSHHDSRHFGTRLIPLGEDRRTAPLTAHMWVCGHLKGEGKKQRDDMLREKKEGERENTNARKYHFSIVFVGIKKETGVTHFFNSPFKGTSMTHIHVLYIINCTPISSLYIL